MKTKETEQVLVIIKRGLCKNCIHYANKYQQTVGVCYNNGMFSSYVTPINKAGIVIDERFDTPPLTVSENFSCINFKNKE